MPVKRLNNKKKFNSFSEEKVAIALERVNSIDANRISLRKAAILYNIPLATLYRRKNDIGGSIGSGTTTVLSRATEELLVHMIKRLADWGYGLTFKHVQRVIYDYLKRTNQLNLFKNGKPGREWFNSFKSRWKHELNERSAGNIAKLRAASCTNKQVDEFFENVNKAYQVANIKDGHHVWNVDETGFSGDQGNKMILCARGAKRPLCITGDNEKMYYTVQNCCNAAGLYVPPMIIYKSKNRLFNTWCVGGPTKAVFTTSPSGWIEEDQFIQWLQQLFVPTIKTIGGQHILVLDGHSSHLSLCAIEICIENNITMLCLPAHSSHILQPLDVGVYGHVKKEWRQILQDYYFNSRAEKLDKENFAPLLKKLYDSNKAFTTLHAVGGFQNTGLYPLNKDSIDRSKLTIAETFVLPTPLTTSVTTPVPVPLQQNITTAPGTPINATSNINSIYLDYAKSSLELALKTHFQIQNTHTKK